MTTMQPPYQPVPPSFKPLELSFPLPKYPHITLHIHLTILATSTLLFLTTTSPGDSSNGGGGGGSAITKPMGSFIYAMPDRANLQSGTPISTALYSSAASIDYATRTARILARRMQRPVYVGCSVDVLGMTMMEGMTVNEEMEGFRKMIETVMAEFEKNHPQNH